MKTSNQLSESPRALDRVGCDGSGTASSWKVRVVVCGTRAGDYEHPTYEAARADADEREKKWGVLGCHYRVIPPVGNLWCAMCGHLTDHQSGTCPEILPQNTAVSDADRRSL